jgi:hypothetical protein
LQGKERGTRSLLQSEQQAEEARAVQQIDPEVIETITQQVLDNLQEREQPVDRSR